MSRSRQQLQKVLVITLLVGLFLAACGPAAKATQSRSGAAQTEAATAGGRADLRVQVVGLLEALGPEAATVGGMRLMINDSTLVDSGLRPNDLVEAQTVMAENGLAAVAIHRAEGSRTASQTFELTGPIESQAAGVWVVGGHRVQVPPAAEVDGTLGVGDLVKVQGSANADGALLAREIRAVTAAQAQADAEIEFTGVVTSIGANDWVIAGRTVQVTAQTELKAGVALGAFVKVHALPQADGRLVAREIELAPAAQATGTPGALPGAEQEFTGLLSAINGDLWTIGGQAVRITANTEVKGTLNVGDLVKVHATPGLDGVLVAREVELARSDDDEDEDDDDNPAGEVEFTGALTAINGDVWTIGGRQVRVTNATEVKGTLQVGDVLKVHASPGADGVLMAREVELAADDDDGDDDNSGPGGGDDDGNDDNSNSGPGGGDDDNSGSGSDDDNSGSGDGDDDNSGSGGGDDDGGDDNSGSGSGGDDDDDDNSGGGGDDDGGNDNNSGSGGGGDDDD